MVSDLAPSTVVSCRDGVDVAHLRDIWMQCLGPKAKDPALSILTVGFGWKRLARLSQMLQDEIGVTVPATALMRLDTFDGLVTSIRRGTLPPIETSILLKDGDDRPALFVCSAGSGLVLELAELVTLIDYPGKTWGLQLPGLDGEAEPLTDMVAIGRLYADAIVARQPKGPYYLIGYSFGGCAALEAARNLAADGHAIGLIGLLDSNIDEKHWPPRARFGHMVKHARRRAAEAKGLSLRQRVTHLCRRAFNLARYATRTAAVLPASAPKVEDSHYYIGGFEPNVQRVRNTSIRAYMAYSPRKVALDATLFRTDPKDSLVCDTMHVWRKFVRRLEVVNVPGSHAKMIRWPYVQTLAAAIAARLPSKPVTHIP